MAHRLSGAVFPISSIVVLDAELVPGKANDCVDKFLPCATPVSITAY